LFERKSWLRWSVRVVLLAVFLGACSAPDSAAPIPDVEGEFVIRDNLARGKSVAASSAHPDHAPEQAVNGSTGFGNGWQAQDPVPQWIEIDLGGESVITSIEMVISQTRTAPTHHKVWGKAPGGEYALLHEFNAETTANQFLTYTPPQAWENIRYLKIETLQTPLFASWQEIQVFGELGDMGSTPGEPADIVFHNGVVISMDDDIGVAEAIAIKGAKISAVGANGDVLSWVGEGTKVIDLHGNTIMPGFVDTHSHAFFNPESVGETPDTIQARLLSEGVTTITEMGGRETEIDHLIALEAAGELRLRVSIYLSMTSNCGDVQGTWYKDYPQNTDPGAMLHIPGLKAFSDGGSCMAPAVSFDYPSGIGQGDLFFSQDEMESLIAQAQDDGYQLAMHAIGDRAIEQVLTAYIDVLNGQPNDLRHRIEHNAVVRPDMYSLYSQSKAVPTIFGPFSTCILEGDRTKFKYRLPDEYKELEWPYRTLIEANPDVVFAWHGDSPVFDLDPIRNLFGFVTRIDLRADGSTCEPPDWLAAQTIPVETALRLMTINAAYALHRDGDVGSLVPGKYADIIMLSGNPLAVEPHELIDLEVWMTMVNGGVEFCLPGRESLCP